MSPYFFTIDIEYFSRWKMSKIIILLLASCLAVMALTNGVLKLVLLYLASCKSHAPPSITVQSGLTEGKFIRYIAQFGNNLIKKRRNDL